MPNGIAFSCYRMRLLDDSALIYSNIDPAILSG